MHKEVFTSIGQNEQDHLQIYRNFILDSLSKLTEKKPVSKVNAYWWKINAVCDWLREVYLQKFEYLMRKKFWSFQIGFHNLEQAFKQNCIDGDLLFSITREHLITEFGLKTEYSLMKFERALKSLKVGNITNLFVKKLTWRFPI